MFSLWRMFVLPISIVCQQLAPSKFIYLLLTADKYVVYTCKLSIMIIVYLTFVNINVKRNILAYMCHISRYGIYLLICMI